jgi:F420-dependent oxidoreductase-like protein
MRSPTTRVALLAALLFPAATLAAPPLRFGIQTPNQNATWSQIRDAWREAESLGFDSAWVYDHFIPIFGDEDDPCLEGWTLLAALAAETRRMQIGVLVSGNTYRNPALLAKMATTVDHVSNGRLALGIGAAWFERDHGAYGFPFGTPRERARKLEEALQVITKLWSEDHPTFRGTWYALDRAPYAPPNVQKPRPPIIVGGQGKQWIIPLVARYADGWNAVTGVGPDGIRERRALIAAECARIGRSDCPTSVSVLLPLVAITRVPLAGSAVRLGARAMVKKEVAREILADSPSAIREKLRLYADAGVTEIILSLRPPFDADLLRRFAAEVMPEFRAGSAPRS